MKNEPINVDHSVMQSKTKSHNSTFVDGKVEDDISRIDEIKRTHDSISDHILPKEIM